MYVRIGLPCCCKGVKNARRSHTHTHIYTRTVERRQQIGRDGWRGGGRRQANYTAAAAVTVEAAEVEVVARENGIGWKYHYIGKAPCKAPVQKKN